MGGRFALRACTIGLPNDQEDKVDRDPQRLRGDVELVKGGKAVLGIEFGSTRIKASLIAPDTTPLASGSHAWENQLKDGVWTYDMEEVWKGLAACYASLADDVRARYAVELESVAALGVSGMMHGYVALDADGKLLVPFRTWRNNITGKACAELTPPLDFAVPQRWSIAHLYQSILEAQPHVPRIAHLTTLAGYVHWRLTGEQVMGVGEASGMFPIDPRTATGTRHGWRSSTPWSRRAARLEAPRHPAQGARRRATRPGKLTADGAKLLDPTGKLRAGIPLCPPEGDAGTGMVATNAVRPRSGNVSAGTSVFAMIVLEKSLSRVHEEIDIVVTPDGKPVAMAHSNNGSSDLDAWIASSARWPGRWARGRAWTTLREAPAAGGAGRPGRGRPALHQLRLRRARHRLHRGPAAVRAQPGRQFTLENFMRAMLFASLCAMRTGMNILTEKEGVVIEEIRGHGGFFKGGDTGQRMMAAALNVPVSIPATAGEGGAWGMAVLAAYMLTKTRSSRYPTTSTRGSRRASASPSSRTRAT